MHENMSTYSTVPSGCSSLESLDPTIQPEDICLTQLDGLIVHSHNDDSCVPKIQIETTEGLIKVDINKLSTKWDGYCRQGGEIISQMANINCVTSPKCYNTTPSTTIATTTTTTTTPIWVKHYKK